MADIETSVDKQIVSDFARAASGDDSQTAAKMLDEVGSCGWHALVSSATKTFDYSVALEEHTISGTGPNGTENTFEVLRHRGMVVKDGVYSNYVTTPLATVHDKKCELK